VTTRYDHPRLCMDHVLTSWRDINTFIISFYHIIKCSLFRPSHMHITVRQQLINNILYTIIVVCRSLYGSRHHCSFMVSIANFVFGLYIMSSEWIYIYIYIYIYITARGQSTPNSLERVYTGPGHESLCRPSPWLAGRDRWPWLELSASFGNRRPCSINRIWRHCWGISGFPGGYKRGVSGQPMLKVGRLQSKIG